MKIFRYQGHGRTEGASFNQSLRLVYECHGSNVGNCLRAKLRGRHTDCQCELKIRQAYAY